MTTGSEIVARQNEFFSKMAKSCINLQETQYKLHRIIELAAAKDYLERGMAILQAAESVIANDVQENINQIKFQIEDIANG